MDNYHIYSDESSSPDNRYRTLGAVSGEENSVKHLRGTLQTVLKETRVAEVKFEEIRTHSPKLKATAKFIEAGILEAANKNIRIDVLLWDVQDSRHSIIGRDDIANFGRMYYKMIRHIGRTWDMPIWYFYPDEHSAINWHDITSCLSKTKLAKYPSEFLDIFKKNKEQFFIRENKPQESHKEPIIQLADVFAGFAWFSKINGEKFLAWRGNLRNKGQSYLFSHMNYSDKIDKLKPIMKNRFKLLKLIDERCKYFKLGVSIETKKCLFTFVPSNPVNFWNYEPQTDFDLAPTRQKNKLREAQVF